MLRKKMVPPVLVPLFHRTTISVTDTSHGPYIIDNPKIRILTRQRCTFLLLVKIYKNTINIFNSPLICSVIST